MAPLVKITKTNRNLQILPTKDIAHNNIFMKNPLQNLSKKNTFSNHNKHSI